MALEELTAGDLPAPSLVVGGGYGLHVVYLLAEPIADKRRWKAVQRGLVRKWRDLGADRVVATDESRVLRLVPYPNRKHWPEGTRTGIHHTSEHRHRLEDLAAAFPLDHGTPFSKHEILTCPLQPFFDDVGDSVEELEGPDDPALMVEAAERRRTVLDGWLRRNMQPGLHYGIIPIDGQEASKPTLFKPGAELVALLYRWRFHFVADLESLLMYGPGMSGAFAYVCHVIDRHGRQIGQGRGISELREPGMQNANKAVKLAEKRAMVDGVLRCAGLSQWFTQDLEEAQYIAPAAEDPPQPSPPDARPHANDGCSPAMVDTLRLWLHRTRKSEREICEFYGPTRLEQISKATAERLLTRLMDLATQRP